MSFIRIININQHYSNRKKRLSSMAFRPSSSNGGISVFDKDCAENTSETICHHIRQYYTEVAGTPFVYWEIPNEVIPPLPCVVKQTDSARGDKCHHEFFNWDYKNAEDTGKAIPLEDLEICTDNGVRQLQISDLPI